jgi:hypothetical protein
MTCGVCALTLLAFLLSGCAPRASSEDVEILRAALQPDACASALPAMILTEPALKDAAKSPQPLLVFGMDLRARDAGERRWPVREICPGVKIANESAVRHVYQVSLPVYSPSGNKAVVAIDLHCGPLCGQGQFIELHKIDGAWRITRTERSWVS